MLQFVVLEHRWNGVHFDFMLEDGEALRTWAIDAPVIAVKAELKARELARHRLGYLDYEGPISGDRGEVRRIDRGTYQVDEWSEDRVRVRLEGAQLVGEVELRRVVSAGLIDVVPWVFRLGNLD